MASTYSSLLRLELIATGEQSGTWGTTTNVNLGTLIEQALSGRAAVSMGSDANYTLTANNGLTDEARQMILNIASGVSLTATRDIIVPTSSKIYVVKNATTGSQSVRVKTTAGSGITVPNGYFTFLACDATNVVSGIDWLNALTVGTTFVVSGGGPHAIGGATTGDVQLFQTGSFSGSGNAAGYHINTTLTTPANGLGRLMVISGTVNKAGSGTHADFASLYIDAPVIGAGAATLTNASTLKIVAAPSVGTNQRALWVLAGLSQFGGAVTHDSTTLLSGALTYGGVTLSNAVTGTGNMVLSASPTLSGTVGGALTFSGALTLSSALTYGGVTLTNAVTGTGSMVLSASPTFTGTLTAAAETISGALTYGGVALNAAVTGTGNMVLSASPTLTGTLAAAAGTFSGTLGLSGAITYGGVTLTNAVTGTGSMVLSASPTLSGTVGGALTFSGSLTLSSALTYGSVTLSNSVTGTGSMVLSASPTLSGTVGGALTFSGAHTLSSALTYGGVALSNSVTGTGSMVLSASPTFTGTLTASVLSVSSTTTLSAAMTYGGVTLSNAVTGTGNMVLSASPTFSGTIGGAVTFSGALTLSSALTYGGVALSNAVTGTGSMVLSASPTLSGTVGGAVTFSGALTLSAALTYGGVTLTNAVTGTGSMVLASSPTLTTAALGSSTATTQSAGDNSTKVATTAYVDGATGLSWVASNAPAASTSTTFSSLSATARYRLVWRMRQNTANGYIFVRFNADSGSNYKWATQTADSAGANSSLFSSSDTEIEPMNTIAGVLSGDASHGAIEFSSDPSDNTIVYFESRLSMHDSNSRVQFNNCAARYDGASNLSSVTLHDSAGTFTGDVVLYKYKT